MDIRMNIHTDVVMGTHMDIHMDIDYNMDVDTIYNLYPYRYGYGFDMDVPKSPWRYPHLMFRSDSRKSKAVSFKQNPGNLNFPPK